MPGNVVKKGDIVLTEKQKDKSRKGGKLASQYFESTNTVVDIHPNANLILKNTNTNEILKTPVPPSHVKKYLKRKLQDNFEDTQDPEVDIEVKMKDYLAIMSGVNEKDVSPQISTTKCNDDGVTTSSGANCKQGPTANKPRKMIVHRYGLQNAMIMQIRKMKNRRNIGIPCVSHKSMKSLTLTACSVTMMISWWWQQK